MTKTRATARHNLEAAVAAHRAGRLAEAEALYRRVLRGEPRQPVALHLLGVLALQRGQAAEAVALIRKALARRPDYPEALNNLGNALCRLERFEEALTAFERAGRFAPALADAHANRSNALKALGRADEALGACEEALRLRPDFADAHFNRGLLLAGLGRLKEAVEAYRAAQTLLPGQATVALRLGEALLGLGQAQAAEHAFSTALRLDPACAPALVNLGLLLQERGAAGAALAAFQEAVALAPTLAEAHNNHANLLRTCGRLADALAAYQRALAADPDNRETMFNRGLARLANGDLAGGWPDHEQRWASRQLAGGRRRTDQPSWTGEPLAGRSLLIWREQGVGDELMFATLYSDLLRLVHPVGSPAPLRRSVPGRENSGADDKKTSEDPVPRHPLPRAPFIKEAGPMETMTLARDQTAYPLPADGAVTIEADPRLVTLLARSLPAAQFRAAPARPATAAPPAEALACAAGSLAGPLRPHLSAFPTRGTGALRPHPELAALWRSRLAALGPRLKVGVCWRSSLLTGPRAHDYTPLTAWLPILRLPGLHAVSLQADGEPDLARLEATTELRVARWPALDLRDDFEGTAALIANLDLVISAPTAIGELAGALGVPVWRTDRVGSWTLLGTACRPWFPAMRPWIAGPEEPLPALLAAIARHLSGLTCRTGKGTSDYTSERND